MKTYLYFPSIQKLLFTGFISCLIACHKESLPPDVIDYTALPTITQNGANTFGCKMNGDVWIPRGGSVEWDPSDFDKVFYFSEKDNSGVGFINCRLVDNRFYVIFGPTCFHTGRYYITGNSSTNIIFYPSSVSPPYEVHDRDSLSNWVDISSIDTVRNIVSGTFQGIVYHPEDSNFKKVITEGRFDMPYYPQ
jgi:hypothetical protein